MKNRKRRGGTDRAAFLESVPSWGMRFVLTVFSTLLMAFIFLLSNVRMNAVYGLEEELPAEETPFSEEPPSEEIWLETPYENEYLMFKTKETGYTFDEGYPFKEMTDVFKGMYEALGLLTDGLTEDPEVWGEAWHFAEMMLKKCKITSVNEVPKWFPENGEKTWPVLWDEIATYAGRGDRQSVLSLLREFSSDRENFYHTPDSNSAKQWYVMFLYDAGTPVINGFHTSEGVEGYCLQWNELFPLELPVNDMDSEEALKEALGIGEEDFGKLLSILHRGYPMNAGLSDTPFENYPEEVLKEGTQVAVWAFLGGCGATGNDGTGNGGEGVVSLSSVRNLTDSELNSNRSTYDAASYVRYLVEGASSENVEPQVELRGMKEFTLTEGGVFRTELEISGAYCEGGLKLILSELPEGAELFTEGMEKISESLENPGEFELPDSFNTSEMTSRKYVLTMPAERNGGKEISASLLTGTFLNPSDLGLLFSEYSGYQVMAKLAIHTPVPVVTEQVEKETPLSMLLVWKMSPEGQYLNEALLELWNLGGEKLMEGRTKDGGTVFQGLQPGETYLLYEQEAPEGYLISEELQAGMEVKMPLNSLLSEWVILNHPVPTLPEKEEEPEIPEEEAEIPPKESAEEPLSPEVILPDPVTLEPSEKLPRIPETTDVVEPKAPSAPSEPKVLGIRENRSLLLTIFLLSLGFLLLLLFLPKKPEGPSGEEIPGGFSCNGA